MTTYSLCYWFKQKPNEHANGNYIPSKAIPRPLPPSYAEAACMNTPGQHSIAKLTVPGRALQKHLPRHWACCSGLRLYVRERTDAAIHANVHAHSQTSLIAPYCVSPNSLATDAAFVVTESCPAFQRIAPRSTRACRLGLWCPVERTQGRV